MNRKALYALIAIVITGGCSYAWRFSGYGLDFAATGSEEARPDAGAAPLAVPVKFDAGT